MVLCDDGECSVCLSPYSRMDKIPRVLHCRHTFCDPCLDTMSRVRSGLLTVPCPLCRRVTCVGRGLSLQEALWVNNKLWEQIQEDVESAALEEDEQRHRAEEGRTEPSSHAHRISYRSGTTKFKLFFRRFSLTRQHQERIIPGSNVEMKSWRRLSAHETRG
uniref:RING-type domain-containing protein n=2 Tax=Nothobranchius korthausae TaxID=1143690 RepID=A0A1A8EXG6_9TELE